MTRQDLAFYVTLALCVAQGVLIIIQALAIHRLQKEKEDA